MSSIKKLGLGLFVGAFTLASNLSAAVTVPTPDYTDFEAIVGVALAVTMIVMLARKGKSFLSH
ncbi:MAG: hypothetical protein PHN38_04155 [Sulfurospirillaceae bacterium]|nr:hypothetical protein [Sulfurospirillaceae bacterium]